MALSNNLEKYGRTDIGLSFPNSDLSPCLNMGVTLAIFNAGATIPVQKEEFIICDKGATRRFNIALVVYGLLSSAPALWVSLWRTPSEPCLLARRRRLQPYSASGAVWVSILTTSCLLSSLSDRFCK